MERALITRLYRDESSHDTVMLMETTESKERIKIMIPRHKAGILALEAHGLNDRCPLYDMFSRCVGELGGAFGSVVLTEDGSRCAAGAISLSRSGYTAWIDADVVELVAFAMHTQTPIYVDRTGTTRQSQEASLHSSRASLPQAFEDALADILSSKSDDDPTQAERSGPDSPERAETPQDCTDASKEPPGSAASKNHGADA